MIEYINQGNLVPKTSSPLRGFSKSQAHFTRGKINCSVQELDFKDLNETEPN